ncbi:PREDICTED: COMM domain-containing protein 5-like [Priapulus caudatus]|uniref:COMM domain-containing protein 5 n=1 Tax=Priapulus caudatus TaxID=37621 RepID=A0ABM1EGW4_PRICU|nr:PREDICTED: COMM domain-containing protein 5-like [Priapulus caudatus]
MSAPIPTAYVTEAHSKAMFSGQKIPPQILYLSKNIHTVDVSVFGRLLQLCVKEILEENVTENEFQDFIATCKCSAAKSEDVLSDLYAGTRLLMTSAFRIPSAQLKPELFKDSLLQLKIPQAYVEQVVSVVFGHQRAEIDRKVLQTRPRLSTLQRYRWRCDVTISTNSLNRVLEPTILMELTLSNGRIANFEVPVSKFHELRYNVAQVLKEMEDLEKRHILKF